MSIRLIAFSRLVIVFGLAVWLTIAVINNLTDPGTNRTLLSHTLSMGLVSTEEVLGAGLLWRAWPAHWSHALLYFIVALQFIFAVFLWRASVSYVKAFMKQDIRLLLAAQRHATFALSLFNSLWMFFICGGLWFGYWLKQAPVQTVHMTLILIGVGTLIFVQTQPHPESFTPVNAKNSDQPSPVGETSQVFPGRPK